MLRQEEGSRAVAEAVALCRPEVISAYPISPQTHIVEHLSDLVRTGELAPCEYLMVESEFGGDLGLYRRLGRPVRAPTRRRRARGCCTWRRRSTTPRAWACRS